jgi:hypothetical protein
MGFSNYFKAKKPESKKDVPEKTSEPTPVVYSEQPSSSGSPDPIPNDFELQIPGANPNASRYSISRHSLGSSMFLDDIKHEVMVNYLYQQQCSHLWVADGSGEVEGVLLRKARGNYMACPPRLATSAFAQACSTLNVHVCGAIHHLSFDG